MFERSGAWVTDHDDRASSIKALHRMIAYLRDEALRLGIVDVALLLDHAEEAVVNFSPVALRERDGEPVERRGSLAEH